ncbi:unnamed protein product [Mytilus coruscus]|uniref:Uncharacterized protein n=1 Tax=Mytilus coruscus TaxID=42192 RepID=A0A6J8F042_MYTCO|nr:unnamed protein product [Mytilus coruscus]
MSQHAVRKQLDRFDDDFQKKIGGHQRREAFLLTDSKGNYLLRSVQRDEKIINFVAKRGATSSNTKFVEELVGRIASCESERPLVMVWLGTCEFTKMGAHRYISINSSETIDGVIERLVSIKQKILEVKSSAEVIFCRVQSFLSDTGMNTKDTPFQKRLQTRTSSFRKLLKLLILNWTL